MRAFTKQGNLRNLIVVDKGRRGGRAFKTSFGIKYSRIYQVKACGRQPFKQMFNVPF